MKRGLPDADAIAETVDAGGVAPPDPLERADSRVLAQRYELMGLVGSGGMGTVYRARDRELDEIVALKMLRKRLAQSEDALARFRREVKLARRVTHRNVARTFDIGEHAGGKFLTMEFIAGEMLRARIGRSGYLAVMDVVEIGRQICAGLAAAHGAGVLHRDLKPENVVMGRDGRAVITDFGIARALSEGGATRSSAEVVGTPAYMAPEQLENATLDERTDIYALGVMLFELLTGDVPWANESPIKAVMARMREPPPDVRAHRPSLSQAISEVVSTCMATRPEDRFESASALDDALARIVAVPQSAPSLAPPRPVAHPVARATVAILPLAHAGDRSTAYLAESVTDDLVQVLGSIPELLVVHASDGLRDPREAGRALGVSAVVSGTFDDDGAQIDVSLRMLTVEDGFEIWSRRFQLVAGDLGRIADEAARDLARVLSTRVTTLPRSLPTDRVAYDLFLRGRSAFLRGWYDAGGEAVRLLGEARARAPENATIAAAYARALARAYGVDDAGDARAAQDAAEHAVSLDPSRAEGRVALALMHLYRGDGGAAALELTRAARAPSFDPDAIELLGRLRAEVGPTERAILHLGVVRAREPSFAEARFTLARVHALRGDWASAEASLGDEPAHAAERVPHLLNRARFALWRGDRELGATIARTAESTELRRHEAQVIALLLGAVLRAELSDDDRARLVGLFPTGTATGQRRAAFNAQIRAEVLSACGDSEGALEALGDADANALLDITWLEQCPLLAPLRGSPIFEGVLRRTSLRAARVRDLLDGG